MHPDDASLTDGGVFLQQDTVTRTLLATYDGSLPAKASGNGFARLVAPAPLGAPYGNSTLGGLQNINQIQKNWVKEKHIVK